MPRIATLLMAIALAPAAVAQSKPCKLRWYGQSFFVLETSAGTRVAFDPHAIDNYGRPVVAADLVCVSHQHNDHTQYEAVENHARVKKLEGVKGTGFRTEWVRVDEKFRDVSVRSVGLFHDREGGMKNGKNAVFVVEADGLKIVHLGDLGHELSGEQVRRIGPVDVLMIPVGGVYTLNGTEAKAVVAKLKPRLCVVPMHYGTDAYNELPTADEFLEDTPNVKRLTKTNELSFSAADPAADPPAVVLLGYKGK